MSIVLDGDKGVTQNTTEAARLPSGTTAERPANPVAGMIRFNTDEGYFEGYDPVADDWVRTGILGAPIQATGGTETTITDNGVTYKVHTFTSSGTFEVTQGSGEVEYLVVAGGGAGGGAVAYYEPGGGGGAGGYRCSVFGEKSGANSSTEPTKSVTSGVYTVTIGAGGAGTLYDVGTPGSGSNSVFGSVISIGGGAGGDYNDSAKDGGSGGGEAENLGRGFGTSGQGTNGGAGVAASSGGPSASGGGGGGSQTAGSNGSSSTGGDGGLATFSSITGTSIERAGGGGGGGITSGSGGGGGAGNAIYLGDGQNALVNTGSGGGSSQATTQGDFLGGNGGSGIVIIRYQI